MMVELDLDDNVQENENFRQKDTLAIPSGDRPESDPSDEDEGG